MCKDTESENNLFQFFSLPLSQKYVFSTFSFFTRSFDCEHVRVVVVEELAAAAAAAAVEAAEASAAGQWKGRREGQ